MVRSSLLHYGSVPVLIALSVYLETLLQPWIGPGLAFLLLWPAVVFSAWTGGTGPGFLATVLGIAAADYFLVEPRHVVSFYKPQELPWVLLFLGLGSVLSLLGGNLRRTMADLRQAERSKNDFLALLGHELRGPLSAAANAVQLLERVTARNTPAYRAAEVLQRQVEQMTRLADDLLDISRISQGKLTVTKRPVPVAELVEQAVDVSQWLIHHQRHELIVSLPPEPLWVAGDRARLVQVISNLLNNAAKYTPEGGHIHLTVAHCEESVLLRVEDDGVGLSPEMRARVFELYTQDSESRDRSAGGLGIGLALVRRLVELHGGTVEADSAGPGKGSTFVVRLPALPGPALCAVD